MPFTLFVPERSPTAAEDAYARGLAAAIEARVTTIAGSAPMPDEMAYASARAAWEALAADARPLIAGASLAAFAPLVSLFAANDCAVLMHHPPTAAADQLAAIERQTLGLVPRIVVSSTAVGCAIAASAAMPSARITVVEPPVPPLARAHGSPDPTTSILTEGEIAPESAHGTLLAALAGLPDLDWQISIIGAGGSNPEHAAEFAQTIARLGLTGRVSIVNPEDRARCEALWLGADIFALAETGPGYGMAIAAALKRGLPLAICRDASGTPLVPPEAGAIAPPADRAQLAKALRRMIFDRDLRREMAQAAYRCGEALPDASAIARQLAAALG